MAWIKCTDRMPPDMEPVMVTMTDGCKITVLPCCRWNNKYNEWDMLNDWNWEEWLALGEKEKVTHWMPWPEPAEVQNAQTDKQAVRGIHEDAPGQGRGAAAYP